MKIVAHLAAFLGLLAALLTGMPQGQRLIVETASAQVRALPTPEGRQATPASPTDQAPAQQSPVGWDGFLVRLFGRRRRKGYEYRPSPGRRYRAAFHRARINGWL